MRTVQVVDVAILTAAVAPAETQSPATLGEFWPAVAAAYNANRGELKEVSPLLAKKNVAKNGIVVNVTKGKPGRKMGSKNAVTETAAVTA